MRVRLQDALRIFLCIFLSAAFVIPAYATGTQIVDADPGIMKWDSVNTPGAVYGMYDINNIHAIGARTGQGSEILDMAAANDGKTIAAVVRMWVPPDTITGGEYKNVYLMSYNSGISWSASGFYQWAGGWTTGANLFQVALAPDDPNVILITSEDFSGLNTGPRMVWYDDNGGRTGLNLIFDGTGLDPGETIRCIDVSADYGGNRDVAFATVNGASGGRWVVRTTSGFGTMVVQPNANGTPGDPLGSATTSGIDYEAIKFSPDYAGDASVALVYANATGPGGGTTNYNVALRDLQQNTTHSFVFNSTGVEVKNPASLPGASPNWSQLNMVDLQLPSDFSGQSSSLRRAYISLDASGFKTPGTCEDGIYRIDDAATYSLMDTTNIATKAIYSIAYYGTYASGKLLAGERMGFPCSATVPTWFTDSPTTCPVPCWYPALKPTTGAANQGSCIGGSQSGIGGALVYWNDDGSLGLVATGSLPYNVLPGVPGFTTLKGIEIPGTPYVVTGGKGNWWELQVTDPKDNDESAFAISRNNGETWNQLSLIDTTIDWLNDVAVAPDCTTIYLASVNRNVGANCNEFDSVWRATINPNVAAPLPIIPPLGTYWERVYCRTTSYNCSLPQTDLPILRLVESCTDKKDGEIVGWAAQHAATNGPGGNGGGVMAWSPDFGDYWATMTPRYRVQDFAFESSTVIYTVSPTALVQRLPYTGTAWSTNLPSYDTTLLTAHTIAAIPDGKVLVGAAANTSAYHQISFSADKGVTFAAALDTIVGNGGEHVIFDVDYKNNQFVYMGDDSPGIIGSWATAVGTVYRNTEPSPTRWVDNDMMSAANGNGYTFAGEPLLAWPAGNNPPHIVGQFGLVQAWTGDPQPALYSAHDNITTSVSLTTYDSAVCRTLKPRNGIPKPGIWWACLDIFAPLNTVGVKFTLEPSSLKYCGCCTLDTNTTLYAIDDQSGDWQYVANAGSPTGMARNIGGIGTGYLPVYAGQFWTGLGLNGRYRMPEFDPSLPGYDPNLKKGMLWAYTDCLAKKGPVLKGPADQFLVGADPVTGRNLQVDLSWEQLCLSTWYQLQIAKDANFLKRINPSVNYGTGGFGVITAVTGAILLRMDAYNMTSPAAWLAPGTLPEAGAIYWWRIRSAKSATTQIADSPWSAARSFTVKAGFIVNTPYYGVLLLSPSNGCNACRPNPVNFSWSPWQGDPKYELQIARDCCFQDVVVDATTGSSAYQYNGSLDYSTPYFWRVRALEINGQNIPSDWSATFSFATTPVPAVPPLPVSEPATPLWVWVIMAIGVILVVATLILIFTTRRM